MHKKTCNLLKIILSNLVLLFLLFLPANVFAEYNGHHIEFMIEMDDGSEIHAYNYLSFVYRKDQTLPYQMFLEENYHLILKNQYVDSLGEMTYFQSRIKYNYEDFDGRAHSIYTILNKKSIDTAMVKTFKIIGLIDQSYAIGISSQHQLADSLWMNNKSLERCSFGGLFCSNDLYIHEESNEVKTIVKELAKVSAELQKEYEKLEEDIRYSEGEDRDQAEEKLMKLEEGSDDRFFDVLNKLSGLKVVIITMCTC